MKFINGIRRDSLSENDRANYKWLTVDDVLSQSVCGESTFEKLHCADIQQYNCMFSSFGFFLR